MADVLNNEAISFLAQAITAQDPAPPALACGLFINDYAIACDTVLSDLTVCTATGYAEYDLTAGDWTIPSPAACVVDCTYPGITFTLTDDGGGQTVYGHYIRDTGRNIFWARLWDTPWVIPSGGGSAVVYPEYISKQCSS